MSYYRIIPSNIPVLEQDEQYIQHIDQQDPLLYGGSYNFGPTPYFKGPNSNTWFKCELVDTTT